MTHSAFSAWMNKKYNEFRGDDITRSGSLASYARLFGASHQVVLGWLREGSQPPRKPEYIRRLVELYGDEALVAMGLPGSQNGSTGKDKASEPNMTEVLREALLENQDEVLAIIEDYLIKHGFRRVS